MDFDRRLCVQGRGYQPEFRMCRVVLRCVEQTYLHAYKHAWKQGNRPERQSGVNDMALPVNSGMRSKNGSLRVSDDGYDAGRCGVCRRTVSQLYSESMLLVVATVLRRNSK